MATVVGGFLSLVALAASILSDNDGLTCLMRGGAAFVGGYFVTQIWYLFVSRPVLTDESEEPDQPVAEEPAAVEPTPVQPEPESTEPEAELEAA